MTASQLPLLDILSPLWTRWRLLTLVFVLSLAVAAGLAPFVKQKYKSEAVLILDRASNDIATFDMPLTNLVIDSEAIASEIEILYSGELAARVVEAEGLLDTKEFNPQGDTSDEVMSAAVNQFLKQLEVQRKGISRAIVVKFESTDAQRAARVVNAIVALYLDHEMERKIDQESIASRRLSDEIAELEARIADSEVRIAEYRQQTGQNGAGDESRREKDIVGLNAQRVLAQAESTAAEALLHQARSLAKNPAAFASLPSSDISPALARLRNNELDLQTSLDQLALTYGEKHPQVQQVRNQLNRTRRDIRTEIDKSLQVLEGTTQNVRLRVDALTAEMQALEQAESGTWSGRAQLLSLERQRESDVDRLEFYSSRLRELSQSSSIENLKPFARVISSGQVSDTAEFPNQRNLLFLLPVLATLGISGLLIISGLFRRFTISGLPALPDNTSWFGRIPSASLLRRLPGSPAVFGDKRIKASVQTLCQSIDTALSSEGRVVMLTGLHQGVGASSVASAVARSYARSGRWTVLVNLDIRKSINTYKASGLNSGELLSSGLELDSLNQALQLEKRTGLYRLDLQLPSVAGSSSLAIRQSGSLAIEQLLSSPALEQLIHTLSKRFSRVILDLPPILDAPDSAMVARLSDLSLIVTTPSNLSVQIGELYRGIERLQVGNEPLLGVVLNRMDVDMVDMPCLDYVASDHHHAQVMKGMSIQSTGSGFALHAISEDVDTTTAPNRLRGESWLLRQSVQQFTLCLMTASSRPNSGHSSLAEAADLPLACYMRRSRDGRPEYVLLLGLFDSHQAAQEMLDKLAIDPLKRTATILSLSAVSRDILHFRSVVPADGRARFEQDVA